MAKGQNAEKWGNKCGHDLSGFKRGMTKNLNHGQKYFKRTLHKEDRRNSKAKLIKMTEEEYYSLKPKYIKVDLLDFE